MKLKLFQIASGVINATASCCPILGAMSRYVSISSQQQPKAIGFR